MTNKFLLKSNDKFYSFGAKQLKYDLTMTSNTTPSPFVVTANSESKYGWNAFNDNSSYWYSNASDTPWIQIKLDRPKELSKVEISTLYPISGSAYGVKDFKVLGSNDGEFFVELYSGTHPNGMTTNSYQFTKTGRYLYYRIEGNSYYSNTTMLITRLNFFENYNYITEIPNATEENFLTYGVTSLNKVSEAQNLRNYVLQEDSNKSEDGLWRHQIKHKPLTIELKK